MKKCALAFALLLALASSLILTGCGAAEAILAEYDEDPDLAARLTAEDDEQYITQLGMTREQAVACCDCVRERIKEHLGDPAQPSGKEERKNEEGTVGLPP